MAHEEGGPYEEGGPADVPAGVLAGFESVVMLLAIVLVCDFF